MDIRGILKSNKELLVKSAAFSIPLLKAHAVRRYLKQVSDKASFISVYAEKLLDLPATQIVSQQRKCCISKPKNGPFSLMMNHSTKCNYRCPICNITEANRRFPDHPVNSISISDFEAFKPIFHNSERIGFMGGLGESLLNTDFEEIVKFLRMNFYADLSITTNGSLLNDQKIKALIANKFRSVDISLHAITKETYSKLQSGSLERVLHNIEILIKMRNALNGDRPKILINYALNALNLMETFKMIDFVAENDISFLGLYHFLDYQGGVRGEISLQRNPEHANNIIDELYSHAREKKVVHKLPITKPYFKTKKDLTLLSKMKETTVGHCNHPWEFLVFKGAYTEKDTYYVGVCGAFTPLKMNYRRYIDKYGSVRLADTWNHPIFQYIRKTCNGQNGGFSQNPLCRYCQSPIRRYYKETDNYKNNEQKRKNVKMLFDELHKNVTFLPDIQGIEIFTEANPPEAE